MRDGGKLRCLRLADLQRHHRLAELAGAGCQPLERCDAVEAFDMQADGGDARVFEHGAGDVGQACLRLVAGGHDIGERQAARLHRDVAGDVGGLRQDGDALFDALHSMLVRPEQGAVEHVDEAVAIRPDD
ncbi:hypothetical protein D3C72_2002820 [compost metagenome]